jgi:hypothetical protein
MNTNGNWAVTKTRTFETQRDEAATKTLHLKFSCAGITGLRDGYHGYLQAQQYSLLQQLK